MLAAILTTVLPHEQRTGGEIVTLAIADALCRSGFSVRMVGYSRPGAPPPPRDAVRAGTRPIETSAAGLRPLAWMALSAAYRIPYSVAKYRSREYLRCVRRVMADRPDVVFVDHAQTCFALAEATGRAPLVFLAHNVESDGYRRLAQEESGLRRRAYRREARLIAAAQRDLVRGVDQVWALTEEDARRIREAGGRDVRPLSVPSRVAPIAAHGADCDVALIGTWSWRANAQGLAWFAQEVLPRLPQNIVVKVAGEGAGWLRGQRRGLDVVGRVPDARDFLAGARALAVPSITGGGVQVKTLDAIATGLPVVATPAAVRGLSTLPRSVTVAGTGSEFAAALQARVDEPAKQPCAQAVEWSRARAERFHADVTSWALQARNGTRAA